MDVMANISAVLEFSLSAIRLIHALNYGCYNNLNHGCYNSLNHAWLSLPTMISVLMGSNKDIV